MAAVGLFAPAAAPAAIGEAIAGELTRAWDADQAVQERLGKLGLKTVLSGERFRQYMVSEQAFYARLIKDANISG